LTALDLAAIAQHGETAKTVADMRREATKDTGAACEEASVALTNINPIMDAEKS
jgi:hypothetical protein